MASMLFSNILCCDCYSSVPSWTHALCKQLQSIKQRPDLCIIFVVILSCGMVLSCAASVGLVILYKYFEQEEKKF